MSAVTIAVTVDAGRPLTAAQRVALMGIVEAAVRAMCDDETRSPSLALREAALAASVRAGGEERG